MSLQYLQDNNGNTTAVVVPIEERSEERRVGKECA